MSCTSISGALTSIPSPPFSSQNSFQLLGSTASTPSKIAFPIFLPTAFISSHNSLIFSGNVTVKKCFIERAPVSHASKKLSIALPPTSSQNADHLPCPFSSFPNRPSKKPTKSIQIPLTIAPIKTPSAYSISPMCSARPRITPPIILRRMIVIFSAQ